MDLKSSAKYLSYYVFMVDGKPLYFMECFEKTAIFWLAQVYHVNFATSLILLTNILFIPQGYSNLTHFPKMTVFLIDIVIVLSWYYLVLSWYYRPNYSIHWQVYYCCCDKKHCLSSDIFGIIWSMFAYNILHVGLSITK